MSRTISFYVTSTAATPAPVPGVEIRSYDAEDVLFENALAVSTTGDDGVAAAVLEPGDYVAVAHRYRWSFDRLALAVLDVAGQVFDMEGSEYAPPSPPEVETCTVYGYIRSPSGEPLPTATVKVSLWAGSEFVYAGGGVNVADATMEVDVLSDGSWSVPLVPNEALTPSGSRYLFEFSWRGPGDNPRIYVWRPRVTVPEAESVEFGTLVEE